MNDSAHLTRLYQDLAQVEEGIRLVHADHDRDLLEKDASVLRKDIERLKTWEAKQGAFVQSETANGHRREATGVE